MLEDQLQVLKMEILVTVIIALDHTLFQRQHNVQLPAVEIQTKCVGEEMH